MKLKLKRHKGQWQSGIYKGNGGVSSAVVCRLGTIRHCLGIFFKLSNYQKALK